MSSGGVTRLKLLSDSTLIDNISINSERTQKGFHIRYLIKALFKYNASDMHLRVDRPPLYRIGGQLYPAKMPK